MGPGLNITSGGEKYQEVGLAANGVVQRCGWGSRGLFCKAKN